MFGRYPIGKEILVTYSAVVNENAVAVVSTNEAKLTYSNNPTTGETKDSQPQKKEVYSAKIVIDKFETGKQDTVKLEGAKFVLYKEVTTDAGTSLVYYKWNTDKKVEWVADKNAATVMTTNAQGEATFGGLADAGAGSAANSFCWFCHAVPKLPLRWAYFLSAG